MFALVAVTAALFEIALTAPWPALLATTLEVTLQGKGPGFNLNLLQKNHKCPLTIKTVNKRLVTYLVQSN